MRLTNILLTTSAHIKQSLVHALGEKGEAIVGFKKLGKEESIQTMSDDQWRLMVQSKGGRASVWSRRTEASGRAARGEPGKVEGANGDCPLACSTHRQEVTRVCVCVCVCVGMF